MPVLAGKYEPATGVMAQVAILEDTPVLTAAAPTLTSEIRLYQALFDTGASCTRISPKVAQEVGLSSLGRERTAAAGGPIAQRTYQFHVGFLLGQKEKASGIFAGNMTLYPRERH